MPGRPQNKYQKRNRKKYNKRNYIKIEPVEKCPFVVGSNEYHNWKRERYALRTLVK